MSNFAFLQLMHAYKQMEKQAFLMNDAMDPEQIAKLKAMQGSLPDISPDQKDAYYQGMADDLKRTYNQKYNALEDLLGPMVDNYTDTTDQNTKNLMKHLSTRQKNVDREYHQQMYNLGMSIRKRSPEPIIANPTAVTPQGGLMDSVSDQVQRVSVPLEDSIRFAEEVGVPQDQILRTTADADQFFTGHTAPTAHAAVPAMTDAVDAAPAAKKFPWGKAGLIGAGALGAGALGYGAYRHFQDKKAFVQLMDAYHTMEKHAFLMSEMLTPEQIAAMNAAAEEVPAASVPAAMHTAEEAAQPSILSRLRGLSMPSKVGIGVAGAGLLGYGAHEMFSGAKGVSHNPAGFDQTASFGKKQQA